MKTGEVFLVALAFLVSFRDARSECVSGDLRFDRDVPSTVVIGSAVSIFPDRPFTCGGRITSWRGVGREFATSTAQPEFQVWRPAPSSPQTFTLVASLPIIVGAVLGNPRNLLRFLSANLTAAVYVQRGDVAGVFVPAISRYSLVVDRIEAGGAVQWIPETMLTRAFCTLETCSSRILTEANIVPKFEIRIDDTARGPSPPVTACQPWLFEPCTPTITVPATRPTTMTAPTSTMTIPTSNTTTPTSNTATPNSTVTTPTPTIANSMPPVRNDGGQEGAIAAGVVVGVLAVAGVVVVIVVVSVLIWRKQKKAGLDKTRTQDLNCYATTGRVTDPVRTDYRNGLPPVANEPQYAPIDSTIRERSVSQHYEFENDPVLNPMYRPSFHNKHHKRPYPRQFPPVPQQTGNKPHEYAVLERSPTRVQTTPPAPMPYAVPLIHGGNKSSGTLTPSTGAPGEGEACYATVKNAFNSSRDSYWEPSDSEAEIYAHLARGRYLEISSGAIKMGQFLGKGQFAYVHKAVWVSQCGEIEVAVKELRRGASNKDRVRFLQEAAIMSQFNHPGIVKLYGVVKEKKPMIILEYLPKGNLREYLNGLASSSFQNVPRQLLKFGCQIALGMDYLSNKDFIHRDLAARNILLTQDYNCKIADFGMSRDLAHQDYYVTSGGRIPLKWTAPEALTHRKYSTKSDVWSFGVVLFEIWAIGKKPYGGTSNPDILKLLLDGQRLPPPPGCPRRIYKLIIQCWNPEPSKRPSFSSITDYLSQEDLSLLHIHADDRGLPPAAYMLGAPLEEGRPLYKDLQGMYLKRPATSDQPPCAGYEVPTSTHSK